MRTAERLKDEKVIWLTTISPRGVPQPNPVWFYWDEKSIIVYSQPTSHKVKNIARNPNVALNFQVNGEGGNVVVLTGDGSLDQHPSTHDPRYFEKYRDEIARIGFTPESLASTYSVLTKILPSKLRGM